jgi:hypothetical protein
VAAGIGADEVRMGSTTNAPATASSGNEVSCFIKATQMTMTSTRSWICTLEPNVARTFDRQGLPP